MVSTHVQFLEVSAFHEPYPLIPSFSPSGGEGARRAVEGDSDRFMAPTHVQILEVFAFHEPRTIRRLWAEEPCCTCMRAFGAGVVRCGQLSLRIFSVPVPRSGLRDPSDARTVRPACVPAPDWPPVRPCGP